MSTQQADDFYFVTNEKNCFIIHIPSHKIVKMPKNNYDLFKDYLSKKPYSFRKTQNNDENKQQIEVYFDKLISYLEAQADNIKNSQEGGLERLMVLTSTECNLRCAYCYADKGSYGYKPQRMSKNTAKKVVSFFTNNFGNVKNVTFFGGEPTLSIIAIESVCKEFENQYRNNKISEIPHFGIITNGTILNERLLNLYRRYKFAITVSIDGPKEIHDELRPFKGGRGSFDTVISNIEKLIDKCGDVCIIGYEVTYTKKHLKAGLTMSSVKDSIKGLTGLLDGIVIPVMEPGPVDLMLSNDELGSVVEDEGEIFKKGLLPKEIIKSRTAQRLLGIFLKKKMHPYICSIGHNVFAIMPNGDIYPCHLLAWNKEFLMGNIFSPTRLVSSKQYKKVIKSLSFTIKQNNKRCQDCIARNFCGGCPARWLIENQWKPYISDEHCSVQRGKTKAFFQWLINAREDSEYWQDLISESSEKEGSEVC